MATYRWRVVWEHRWPGGQRQVAWLAECGGCRRAAHSCGSASVSHRLPPSPDRGPGTARNIRVARNRCREGTLVRRDDHHASPRRPGLRIETKHTQFEALPQPVSSSELMPRADQTANVAQTPLKIIEQHRRSASAVKSALMLPRPRRGNGTSKAAANAGRDKPVAQVKPCRSGAFDGLFKTLNLSTRCQT